MQAARRFVMRLPSAVSAAATSSTAFTAGRVAAVSAGAMASAAPALAKRGFVAGVAAASVLGATAAATVRAEAGATIVPAATPRVVFVLGGPGAGKGTQCAKLVENYGYVHLSAGDLLRAERNSGSPDGDLIQSYIKEGKIVPVEITVNLIKKAMAASGASLFLIDGFPRNFDNVQGWNRVMGDSAIVEFVLFYDTDEKRMEQRILSRAKTSGRTDDNLATIKKRFHTFVDSTMPVVNLFAEKDMVRRVPSSGTVEEVFAATKVVMEPMVRAAILNCNQMLLDALAANDVTTMTRLSEHEITAFECPEAGMEFKGGKKSTMVSPNVSLSGNTAVVTYVRKVEGVGSFNETRVWQRTDHKWRQVHVHTSKAH